MANEVGVSDSKGNSSGKKSKKPRPERGDQRGKKKGKTKAARKAKAATKKAPKKAAKREKTAPKREKPAKKIKARSPNASKKSRKLDVTAADPMLFAPLSEGERADALRVLTEDLRLSAMAKVGRYRVIAVEPQVVKPPDEHFGCRLARVVAYDYSTQRTVDATIDLDHGEVAHLTFTRNQPMLSRDEEAIAVGLAMRDERIESQLGLGDEPLVAMHYWSNDPSELAYSRRSAAVVFGHPGRRPSVVAIVDLIDNIVTDVVPAAQW